jgi:mono/diheme cytochrome c family protein
LVSRNSVLRRASTALSVDTIKLVLIECLGRGLLNMRKLMTLAAALTLAATVYAADAAAGKKTYEVECKDCHKMDGGAVSSVAKSMTKQGVTMRDLKVPEVQSQTDAQWKTTINAGTGKMKGAKLSAADVDNIIAFMRTLKK